MFRHLIFFQLIIVIILGLGCANSPIGEDPGSDGGTEHAILVGSPTTEAPPEKRLEKYLIEHKVWKTSLPVEGSTFEKIHTVEFDVQNGKAKILLPENSEAIDVGIMIDDEDNLSTEEGLEYSVISSDGRKDSEKYPFDIFLFSKNVSGRLFASSQEVGATADAPNPDSDLLFDGEYFVAGSYNGKAVIHDTCSEDKATLYEAVSDNSVEEVKCNCANGKCIDNPAEVTVIVLLNLFDICNYDMESCEYSPDTSIKGIVQTVKDEKGWIDSIASVVHNLINNGI